MRPPWSKGVRSAGPRRTQVSIAATVSARLLCIGPVKGSSYRCDDVQHPELEAAVSQVAFWVLVSLVLL